jgi:hypothetical protein
MMEKNAIAINQTPIATYLNRFSCADFIEIRCIKSSDVKRFWIHKFEYSILEPQLLELNNEGFNIFASVNPRRCKGSNEEAISQLAAFHADVDCPLGQYGCFAAKSPQGGDESISIPLPSLVVNSGHGWHLYWQLADPIPVTPANRSHFNAINRGLAHAVGGDPACCDLARILRIPGFINHKPPAMPIQIAAHRPVTYTLEEMIPFAAEAPAAQTLELGDIPEMTEELKQRFADACKADKSKDLMRAWRGEIGDGSSDSRHVLVKMLAESGQFSAEEIVAITCGWQWYNRRSKQLKDPEAVREDAIRLVSKLA